MSTKKEVVMLDKDDYYKDTSRISFSGLKIYSKCETLYRDMFVSRVYEEPEKDYFVYGKLVDAIVTETPKFVEENFIRVDKRVNPEDALKIENDIKALEEYIEAPEFQEKLAKGNKTAQKGYESRIKKIAEAQSSLNAIKDIGTKQQVTNSVWQNAEETAQALKSHPYFPILEFNAVTSQQIFESVTPDGIHKKGKLDHLRLSTEMTKIYAIYKANQITLEELQTRIKTLNPNDLRATITDIKTCFDIAKLEPYNTHYRGQLGFYQDLVSEVLLIPIENIKCQILAADKLNNQIKKAELFVYTQEALDELKPDVAAWMRIWKASMDSGIFTSSKEKNGIDQKCFTCSECRFCPLSKKPGEAVVISKPRFGSSEKVEEISLVDIVADY